MEVSVETVDENKTVQHGISDQPQLVNLIFAIKNHRLPDMDIWVLPLCLFVYQIFHSESVSSWKVLEGKNPYLPHQNMYVYIYIYI